MKSKILLIIAIIELSILPSVVYGGLAQDLSGRILLQAQANGEAWYLYPDDQRRYFMGRPDDAFILMRRLSLGINNADLNKIPVGLLDYAGTDSDADGLNDNLEEALGTDPNKTDSDQDGFNDKTEIINKYNPLNQGVSSIDPGLTGRLKGKILLQVEGAGAAWYLNPADNKRYYLGRPVNAWQIMRGLSLGITDKNLEQIAIGQIPPEPINQPNQPNQPNLPNQPNQPNQPVNPGSILNQAAASIRNDDSPAAQAYFIESMRQSIAYSIEHLSAESRLLLANLLSGAELTSSTENEKIYSNTAYFSLGDLEVPLTFRVQKQADGSWLIANL